MKNFIKASFILAHDKIRLGSQKPLRHRFWPLVIGASFNFCGIFRPPVVVFSELTDKVNPRLIGGKLEEVGRANCGNMITAR